MRIAQISCNMIHFFVNIRNYTADSVITHRSYSIHIKLPHWNDNSKSFWDLVGVQTIYIPILIFCFLFSRNIAATRIHYHSIA